MDDFISRQAAIEAIDRLDIPEDMCVFEILSHIELELGTLPSAQPSAQQERIKGHWVEIASSNHTYKCSECGRIIQTTDGRRNVSKHYPFCHCGADMRGEQDDSV